MIGRAPIAGVMMACYAAASALAAPPNPGGASDEDEDVIILDFGDEEPETTTTEEAAAPAFRTTLFDGTLSNELAVDTGHESASEHIVRMKNRLGLALSHDISAGASVRLSGRMTYWFWSNERGEARYQLDPELRDTYLRWVFPEAVDVTVGLQTWSWGAMAATSPTDVLNPVDLRESVSAGLETPKVPVLGLTLSRSFGAELGLTAVWIPLFVPNRQYVFGDDLSLLGPDPARSPLDLPPETLSTIEDIDPTAVDELQPALLSLGKPDDSHLENSTAGLRVTSTLAGIDLGASYVYGWDRLPIVEIDPRLDSVAVLQDPDTEPDVLAEALDDSLELLLALSDGTLSVTDLFRSRYVRSHTAGVDMVTTVWDLSLRGEAAYSSAKVAYDDELGSVVSRAVHWAAGVEYMYETTLILTVEASHQHLFDVPEDASLFLSAEDNVELAGILSLRLLRHDALQIQAAVLYGVTLEDWIVVPQVMYKPTDVYSIAVGGRFFEGPALSRGGYYDMNDEAFLVSRVDF